MAALKDRAPEYFGLIAKGVPCKKGLRTVECWLVSADPKEITTIRPERQWVKIN
jgi:hypothetical protein